MPVKLTIHQLAKPEVYKDLVRIPEIYRLDSKGKTIPEGAVCKITAKGKSVLVSVRGYEEQDDHRICMDAKTRNGLGVSDKEEHDFTLDRVGWIGQVLWLARASDPFYRIAARLAAVSLALTFIGCVLSVLALCFSK